MEERRIRANGLTFRCFLQGRGRRTALLLHGFPDDAGSMEPLMNRLVGAGFTSVAPFLRGYGETGSAPDGKYDPVRLSRDAIGLAREIGGEEMVLVGHDWGALAGYAAANLAPKQFSRIVAMALPPPRVLLRNLLRHPRQLRRSWYISFFQLPWIPERLLARDDFAFLERLWRDWSPGWNLPAGRIASVKRTFRAPSTVGAALAYYRALMRGAISNREDYRTSLRICLAPIETPTLVLAGRNDGCMGLEVFEGLDRAFRGPFAFEVVEDAGHFMHLEQPERVGRLILEFLEA
jgi:pimeloyl-ACP methyl ester carboxylesterase